MDFFSKPHFVSKYAFSKNLANLRKHAIDHDTFEIPIQPGQLHLPLKFFPNTKMK